MILFRWLLNAAALIVISYIVPGFDVHTTYSALIAALILGIVNVLIRPILFLLTLPVNILTLGLFTFIINALMLELVSTIVKGFDIANFRAALLGALILTAISWLTNHFLNNDQGKIEVVQ